MASSSTSFKFSTTCNPKAPITTSNAATRWILSPYEHKAKTFHFLSFSSKCSAFPISCCQHQSPPSSFPPLRRRRRPEYILYHIDCPLYIRIFYTTLRDGEQSPGAALTAKEELDIARQQLAKLGMDIIEAGFPATSQEDFVAVKMIAQEVGNVVDEEGYVPVICGLSRCNEKDITAVWDAVKYVKRPRIHTFIATSVIHMKYKLGKMKEEVIEFARRMVKLARSLACDDVQFRPKDAGRSEREFLYEILGQQLSISLIQLV